MSDDKFNKSTHPINMGSVSQIIDIINSSCDHENTELVALKNSNHDKVDWCWRCGALTWYAAGGPKIQLQPESMGKLQQILLREVDGQ